MLICLMGSQHNLAVGSMFRRAPCGAPEFSSQGIGCCIASSPLWSPLPLRGLQAEAGRWKTERRRQLYKHPQAVLM